MADTKQLARLSTLHLNTGDRYTITAVDTIGVPSDPDAAVWARVTNLKSLQPSTSARRVDTEDFDNAGWADHLVTGRSGQVTGTYNKIADVDADPNTFDAGQEALEALALEMGADAEGQWMIRVLGTDQVYIFDGSVEMGNAAGGGLNDLGEIGFTITWAGIPYKGDEPALTA